MHMHCPAGLLNLFMWGHAYTLHSGGCLVFSWTEMHTRCIAGLLRFLCEVINMHHAMSHAHPLGTGMLPAEES